MVGPREGSLFWVVFMERDGFVHGGEPRGDRTSMYQSISNQRLILR